MVPYSLLYSKAQAPLPAQFDARKAGAEELSEALMTTHLRLPLLIQQVYHCFLCTFELSLITLSHLQYLEVWTGHTSAPLPVSWKPGASRSSSLPQLELLLQNHGGR